ncbi:MAG: hypothetical protein JNK05_13040 [Myxococcales bacterium]|nr:hypothetical protein [Myxococcales bacterium]
MSPIANERLLRGRWVTVHTEQNAVFCEGSLQFADEFVERASEYLGVAPRPVDYYLYRSTPYSCLSPARAGAGSPPLGGDCALRYQRVVMASNWLQQHELAHVVAQAWGEDAPAILEEGLATMLGSSASGVGETIDRSARIEDNLDSNTFIAWPVAERLVLYRSTASFLRFVEARFGHDALRRWYSTVDNLMPPRETMDRFARATGASLSSALEEWRSEPAARTESASLRLVECSHATGVLSLDRASWDAPFSCRGFNVGASPSRRSETVEVERDGWYALDVASGTAVDVTIDACDAATPRWTLHTLGIAVGSRSILWLQRGRHQLDFVQRVASSDRLRWSLVPSSLSAARCDSNEREEIRTSLGSALFVAAPERWPITNPSDPTRRAVTLRIGPTGSAHYRTLFVRRASASASLRVCTTACDEPQCVELREGGSVLLRPNVHGEVWVELDARADAGIVQIAFE